MLYWSVGGASASARYIHRTTLDGAASADNVQQFIDVTDNSVTAAAAAAVQDIVVDVRTRRFAHPNQTALPCISFQAENVIFKRGSLNWLKTKCCNILV